MKSIVAGIVLFNPDIKRLGENISAIIPQIDTLILVDNASDNIEKIQEELFLSGDVINAGKIKLISNDKNMGIAKALNQICEFAESSDAEWVLTLDQDSVCYPELMSYYRKYVDIDQVASMTCLMKNRSEAFELEKGAISGNYVYVNSAITSGNYISLSAWREIGGFDENLFIDKVDTDFSFRLELKGYKQIKVNYLGVLHEIGENASDHYLFGKHFVVYNHSPFRNYHLIRNQIYFARKYENIKGKRWARRIKRTSWTRIIVYLLYEDRKTERIKAWHRGLRDGYAMKL